MSVSFSFTHTTQDKNKSCQLKDPQSCVTPSIPPLSPSPTVSNPGKPNDLLKKRQNKHSLRRAFPELAVPSRTLWLLTTRPTENTRQFKNFVINGSIFGIFTRERCTHLWTTHYDRASRAATASQLTFLCTRLRSSWMPSKRKLMSSLASCCWWPANMGAYWDTTFFRVLGTTTEYSPDHACGKTNS